MSDIYSIIIGTISLAVGAFSLYFSIVGYYASKKASLEAKAAKEEISNVKKLMKKINNLNEIRLSLQEDLLEACNEEKRIDKASKLSNLLKRIQKLEKDWEMEDMKHAVNDIQYVIQNSSLEKDCDIGMNTRIMSDAEGIVKAFIDYLRNKQSELSEEQL